MLRSCVPFFLCKSMAASFFFFFFAGQFLHSISMCFLHRMCTSVCQCTCVYMHMCSNRQCICVSLQSPLIYHAISAKRMLSFQFFLFLFFLSFFFFFFFFLLTTAYSCVKVFVSTIVAGSLVMHHLLGSVMYALFSRMVASSHWRAFTVVSRSPIHSITLSQPRFFFFFSCSLHSISVPTSMY